MSIGLILLEAVVPVDFNGSTELSSQSLDDGTMLLFSHVNQQFVCRLVCSYLNQFISARPTFLVPHPCTGSRKCGFFKAYLTHVGLNICAASWRPTDTADVFVPEFEQHNLRDMTRSDLRVN